MLHETRSPVIERAPDLQGHGRAWKVTHAGTRPEQAATLRAYIVHAPHGNPLWPWYSIAVYHLREIAGTPAPKLHFKEATHEFLIAAIDPNTYEGVHPDRASTFGHLQPLDLVHQESLSDEHAAKILDLVVRHIIEGGASPDQDFREWWKRTIAETADHFRRGIHS